LTIFFWLNAHIHHFIKDYFYKVLLFNVKLIWSKHKIVSKKKIQKNKKLQIGCCLLETSSKLSSQSQNQRNASLTMIDFSLYKIKVVLKWKSRKSLFLSCAIFLQIEVTTY